MLTDQSYQDSLDDSLKPSQLKSIEAEFETNKLYRLTYSSEEDKDDYDEREQILQNDNICNYEQIEQLIANNNYAAAYNELNKLQSNDLHYYFLYTQVCYALHKYNQVFEYAEPIIQSNNPYISNTLEMLVDISIKTKQFELALEYQLQLINCNQEIKNEYQITLAEIYLQLDKHQQAYYSYLHAYKNGAGNLIETITLLSYDVDYDNFMKYAIKYLEEPPLNECNQIKILFYMSKQTLDIKYQQRGVDLLIQYSGLRNMESYLAISNLGEMKFRKQQYQEALRDFELGSEIIQQLEGQQQKYYMCIYKVSQCYYHMSSYQQCLDCLLKLKEDPIILCNIINIKIKLQQDCIEYIRRLYVSENVIILNEVGNMLQQGRQINLAVEVYQYGLKFAQGEQQLIINLNLAGCFQMMRDYERCVELLKECCNNLQSVTQQCEIKRKIGRVYKECGKLREGLMYLKQSLGLARKCGQDWLLKDIQNEINQF